jgi:exopolyphosphatase
MALPGWLRGLPARLAGLQEVTVVMGNEACDLDSGVCAVVLAFHLSSVTQLPVLPLLNIPTTDFVLKTELVGEVQLVHIYGSVQVAALAAEGVGEELLWFRDSRPDPLSLPGLRLVLVDHNMLPVRDRTLEDRVVEVLDHHVRETDLQEDLVTIEPVGSCASLVLRRLLADTPDFREPSCLRLVREAILLDTVCLRPEAQRVTPTDLAMVEEVEGRLLGIAKDGQDRQQVFDWLLEEKGRVGHLDTHQLLRRDLKVDKFDLSVSQIRFAQVVSVAACRL